MKITGEAQRKQRCAWSFLRRRLPLISLKAGGTGLNLTAASVIIHFDPWWNMAAQNQATDRAHRIGQKQVVTVYKLIMKDTLEEKILKLQEQKARLSDEIISEGSIKDALATREELLEILK
ncbi:MAG TPA: SWF/SNF helicase family protein [Candidatus Cottocaccamicrobium excrementipullorum]|nr:SWF/SNF helicase family protein [Candidatus Cottocaccamicrobium excrementipullorum]